MQSSRMFWLGFIGTVLAISAPAHSEQPTDASTPATPPTTQPAATDNAPPGPSAQTLRRAKALGLKPEVRKGATVYCWKDASLGTRFETKKCVDENGLASMVQRLESEKLQIQQGQAR